MKKINSVLELCALGTEYEGAGNVIQRACELKLLEELFEVVEIFHPNLREEDVVNFVENYGAYALLVVPFTIEAAVESAAQAILSDWL